MRPTGSIGHMFSRFFYALAALFSRNTERSKGGSVVISHSLLSHGGRHGPAPIFSLLSRLQPYLDNTHVHHFQQDLLMCVDGYTVYIRCRANVPARGAPLYQYVSMAIPPETSMPKLSVSSPRMCSGPARATSHDRTDHVTMHWKRWPGKPWD